MFTLSKLLLYPEIIIQCHDNPDADTLASGFALHEYFKSKGKMVRLIYSGRSKIVKSNLLEMVNSLGIPITYVDSIETNGLLITVDCQYGANNVKKFAAAAVAMIDHHEQKIFDVEWSDIRPYLGSCSTLIWQLLKQEKSDFNSMPNVVTALYYGLFTDTNNLEEINHPLDKDMRDSLSYNRNLIRKLRNSNFRLKELQLAGLALSSYFHNSDTSYAIVKSPSGDPATLGFISDAILQAENIKVCIAYNETGNDVKLSVRSCVAEVMANELAAFLTEKVGFGGGNIEKGAGYFSIERLKFQGLFSQGEPFLHQQQMIEWYLAKRVESYYDSFEVIHYHSHQLFAKDMKAYKKKKLVVGAVHSISIFPEGAPILIRTLEGDMEVISGRNIYIMIGVQGEAYPITLEKYAASYRIVNQPFQIEAEYSPTVYNRITAESVELMPYAHACVSTGETLIYAKALTRRTKVFSKWNYTSYMTGREGDCIVFRQDDPTDVYIIRQDIFKQTYVAEDENEDL